MVKKGYNWRARQIIETKIDNAATRKIPIDISHKEYNSYDQSNEFVLPSKKRRTTLKNKSETIVKILSKSQRKRLEKIVDKKRKKENRSSLLEALASVQASQKELDQLTTIASVQTKGLKKFKKQTANECFSNIDKTNNKHSKISSVAGTRKRKSLVTEALAKQQCLEHNPNDIVDSEGTLYSSTETESEDDEYEERNKVNEDSRHRKTNENGPKKNSLEEKRIHLESNTSILNENHIDKENRTLPIEVLKNNKKGIPKQVSKPNKHSEKHPAVFIELYRDPDMQAARLKLPILGEEQVVMECINENEIIILAGETGSGKTTQVPQFLYEAGYAKEKMIGVTEPRRVAAVSMSERVAKEMNLSSREVSYLIRFEGNTTQDTKIKFMTDGVLLKEIQADFSLNSYSVIILDEAHERSVYTDILIGLLSRIVPYRNKHNNPLKLIIMSATLRVEDFTENIRLFKAPPPVIKIDSRQFPVSIHFNKRTPNNYMTEAFKKAVKIHTTLPEGGILIFLTGQQEVNALVKKLRRAFPYRNIKNSVKNIKSHSVSSNDSNSDNEDTQWDIKKAIRLQKKKQKKIINSLPEVNLDDYQILSDDADADLREIVESCGELSDEEDCLNLVGLSNTQPLWVLPMYSLLPSHKQSKVFKNPPDGTRLCVVSTNVAETSLTIPNIKYVIDSGRQKTRIYDKITGVSAFIVTNTSKAGANQRAGRAGRTGPGHCYRLYSSSMFNNEFKDFTKPEIQCRPVDDLMLQMKSMGIDKVVNFPFPSAPDLLQLKYAETRLMILGALDSSNISCYKIDQPAKISKLGKAISAFPVAPRFGKMLALSHQHNLLPYTVCMVAALSVQEVLVEVSFGNNSAEKSKWTHIRRLWAGTGNSLLMGDPMVLLKAVGAAEYAGSSNTLEEFCIQQGLRPKAISEIRKLRVQLINDINLNIPEINLYVDPKMNPPTDLQAKLIRQILLSGLGDHVALKIKENDVKENEDKRKLKYAYQCNELEDPVFIHSCSVLRKQVPEWVVYQEVYETQVGDSTKIFIRGITAIEPEWLAKYVPMLCNFSEPLSDPEPRYCTMKGKIYCHVNATYGKAAWPLPIVEIEFPNNLDSYKWFAKFLLDGVIFEKLEKYKNCLLSKPATMTKSWARLLPRTDALLKTLATKCINTKERLQDMWQAEPKYLLGAYQLWLPESAHSEVALLWPPTER